MEVIINRSLDPYFNLAAEEYLLETSPGDIFMLWRNDKAVVVGKNQNTFAEINPEFVRENGIAVVRRLTGGGAVFHDPGNINFTFISSLSENGLDFLRFIKPVISMLSTVGINAVADGRNDILAGGAKISGNAQCVYNTADKRQRVMHHGTLLFSADMKSLSGALKVSEEKMKSKGIKSVQSRVVNIRSIPTYSGPEKAEDFLEALAHLYGKACDIMPSELSGEQIKDIEALAESKYRCFQWNFGASPEFSVTKEARFPFGTVAVGYSASGGIIQKLRFTGDFFSVADVSELEQALSGTRLDIDELSESLAQCGKYISGSTPYQLASLILD